MQHYQYSVRIEAPVEHIWALLSDSSRWHEWSPAEYSDFSGPLDQVGTTYVQLWRLGFDMKSTFKVLEVDPPRAFRFGDADGSMDATFRLEPEGDGTLLAIEGDYEMPAHLPGVVQNLMSKHWIDRQMRSQLENIKAVAEATIPVPA